MDNTSLAQITEIAAKVFKVHASILTPQSSANSVDGWDSLGHASFIAEVETALNVKFSLIELVTLSTLQEIADNIDTKRNGG
jgi:acyl carrier protein